jgi:PKD repeat protein
MRISPVRLSVLGALVCLIGCGNPLPKLVLHLCSEEHGDVCDSGASSDQDGGTEPEANCSDGKQNNDETDVDCGGSECAKCESDAACGIDSDCASDQCMDKVCVVPPTAAFTLSARMGGPRLTVSATNRAQEGSSPIREILYDWDDGQGFESFDAVARHTFNTGGSYTVRQRVTDARGVVKFAEQPLDVVDSVVTGFRQARFSVSDRTENLFLSPDRLSVEERGLYPGGVRSDVSVAPMSRVYYFEAERLIARTGNWGFGVATAQEALENEVGHHRESMGVLTLGSVFNNTGEGQMLANCTRPQGFPPETRIFGFVVDYRAANPRIHLVIDQGTPAVPVIANSCTMMGVSAPLYIFYSGSRYEIGYQARINTGADTTNHPFHFTLAQLVSALGTAGQAIAMGDIVYGFGGTRALPANMPPSLNAPADQSVAFGRPVMLSASAADPEDTTVNMTSLITWLDLASQHHAPVEGVGGSFTFTPSAIGRHPIRVSVRDSVGNVTSKLVQVEVTGELPHPDPVLLAPDAFGGGDHVILSDDHLGAQFKGNGKYGIRANQGIYRGSFQYFEAHREQPSGNMGVGVVIGDGLLNPYHFEEVPWSCSVNLTGNTWRNLIDLTIWDGNMNDRYGFAVDYRGEHPLVHILIGTGSTAKLESSLLLDDIWVPIYPMVYGNPQDSMGSDITINFGATPFQFDPRALVPGGSAMQLGWGVHMR